MEITRRSEPTKLDQAVKGTKCKVTLFPEMKDGIRTGKAECVTYLQVSSDENEPIWEKCRD